MKTIIEITEDVQLPGTDIILEKGDKIRIVEAYDPEMLEKDTPSQWGVYRYGDDDSEGTGDLLDEFLEDITSEYYGYLIDEDGGQMGFYMVLNKFHSEFETFIKDKDLAWDVAE